MKIFLQAKEVYGLRLFYEGLGNIMYETPSSLGAGGAALANNGASISGGTTVVLGNDVGGTAGQLLSNREIPMNGFTLLFSHIGLAPGPSELIFQADASKLNGTAFQLFLNSAGAEIGRINFAGTAPGNASSIFGAGSGINLTTGLSNTIIGANSGALITTGQRNVSVGVGNLPNSQTSNTNIAIGVFVMEGVVTGAQNIAIGQSALDSLTSGSTNIGIGGVSTLAKILTATNNIAIGTNALSDSLVATNDASNRIAIGANAGQQQNVGAGTILIGHRALFGGSGSPGTNNTLIGFQVVTTGGVNGNDNVLLGSNIAATGGGTTFGNGNIVIGANSGINGLASIANLTILGQGITVGAVPNVAVIGRADQNILIGNTTIAAGADNGSKLQVNGGISLPLRSTAVNTTLAFGADHTLIITGATLTITLPALVAGANGIFAVINQNAAGSTFSANYINKSGAAVNTIPANSAVWIQANGATNWQQIN